MKEIFKNVMEFIDIAIAIIIVFIGMFFLIDTVSGQSRPTTFKDSVYKAQSARVKQQPRLTPYKWEDSKGNQYPIYIGPSGACYVVRISKNGNEYKQYLGEEISRDICNKMGVAYAPKRSRPSGH